MTGKSNIHQFLNEDYPIDYAFEPVGAANIEPPKWIIKGVIPVGLTIVVSPPKQFKSTFLLHLILRIIGKNSTLLPEQFSKVTETGPVIAIATETTAGAIKFDALFGMRTHILASDPFYAQTNPFAYRLDNEHDMIELFYWLKRVKPKALIIDPFRNSHSVDENDSTEIIKILQPLQQYAFKNDMAIIVVHHTVKRGEKSKIEEFLRPESARGSGSIFGIADGILMQMVLPHEEMTDEPITVRWAGQFRRGSQWQEDVTPNLEWAKLKLDVEVAAKVYNTLNEFPLNTQSLCDKLNMREVDLLKYILFMDKHKIITKGPGGAWMIEI